jgi:hypothetical protein
MTTQSSTMTYAVSATTRAGGAASVHVRTSEIAFDGCAPQQSRLRIVTDEPAARIEPLYENIRKFGTIT